MNFNNKKMKLNRKDKTTHHRNKIRQFCEVTVSFIVKVIVIAVSIFYFDSAPPIEIICSAVFCLPTAYAIYSSNESWRNPGVVAELCVVVYAPSRALKWSMELMDQLTMNYNFNAAHHLLYSMSFEVCGLLYVGFSGYIFVRLLLCVVTDNTPMNVTAKIYPNLLKPTVPSIYESRSDFKDCESWRDDDSIRFNFI